MRKERFLVNQKQQKIFRNAFSNKTSSYKKTIKTIIVFKVFCQNHIECFVAPESSPSFALICPEPPKVTKKYANT